VHGAIDTMYFFLDYLPRMRKVNVYDKYIIYSEMAEFESHFTKNYVYHLNEIFHRVLRSTWYYKFEIYEVEDLFTAILITYDEQEEDEFVLLTNIDYKDFLERMSKVKSDWKYMRRDTMSGFKEKPEKTMGGWEGRTIYIIKGGLNTQYWQLKNALEDTYLLISGSEQTWGPLVLTELEEFQKFIPVGIKHIKDFEHLVRVSINFLFIGDLGEAVPQVRTEPGNEGLEIRDLICSNNADTGFWKDLKDNYGCLEILFDAKNTRNITRDDLRQVYCYLKRAIGFWGFIVCRGIQESSILAYNRTLYQNFEQKRGVLILTDTDLRRMVEMKIRGRNPTEYLRVKMSEFLRSV